MSRGLLNGFRRPEDEDGIPVAQVDMSDYGTAIEPSAPDPRAPQSDSELVGKYIRDRYFGDELGDDALKAAQDQARQDRFTVNMARAGATIGTGIAGGTEFDDRPFEQMGKDAGQPVADIENRRKGRMEAVRFGREEQKFGREQELQDPNSAPSRVFQNALKAAAPGMFSPDDLATITAADKENVMSLAQLKETIAARKQTAALAGNEKKRVADEKKNAGLREVVERSNNIQANLQALDGMIAEDGTWEMLGSHNQDMDRRIDQIATDMAKLQDPDSVARPAEVDLIKRGLVQAGFKNSNATARNILANFKQEMEGRVANAYRIRGIQPGAAVGTMPAGASDPATKTVQQPEGWDPQKEEKLQMLRKKKAAGTLATR